MLRFCFVMSLFKKYPNKVFCRKDLSSAMAKHSGCSALVLSLIKAYYCPSPTQLGLFIESWLEKKLNTCVETWLLMFSVYPDPFALGSVQVAGV